MPGKLATTGEASKLLRERYGVTVSGTTIRMWLEEGLVPGELVGGLWVVNREKLCTMFEQFILDTAGRIEEMQRTRTARQAK
jgi:hypothetical protein